MVIASLGPIHNCEHYSIDLLVSLDSREVVTKNGYTEIVGVYTFDL
jgi:hypothetical protein